MVLVKVKHLEEFNGSTLLTSRSDLLMRSLTHAHKMIYTHYKHTSALHNNTQYTQYKTIKKNTQIKVAHKPLTLQIALTNSRAGWVILRWEPGSTGKIESSCSDR